jgi:hypothetical protein
MVTIALLFVFIAAALVGVVAKGWNLGRSFGWISSFPTVLFLGSLAGLRSDSNSWLFFEGFVLSLLFSVLAVGLGIWLIVFRVRRRAPVRREVVLTVLASCPIMYAVVNTNKR